MSARTTMSARVLFPVALLALGVAAWACTNDETIDGSKVPPVGSAEAPPSCEDVCLRLEALCGYAPVACVETCAAEAPDGWDDAHRACKGESASCRDALSCENEDAEEDAGEEEPGEEDDAGDAGEEDADLASDAGDLDAAADADGS